jgi:hypothetical protein
MTRIDKALNKMRRLWVLERSARAGLLIAAVGVLGVLLVLLLGRLGVLPAGSVLVVVVLAAIAMIVLAVATAMRAPGREELARLMDQRAGARDRFASALEFASQPQRFGWLGELTCQKAITDAQSIALRLRLSVGPVRQWAKIGAVAGLLVAGNIAVMAMHGAKSVAPPPRPRVAANTDASPACTRAN